MGFESFTRNKDEKDAEDEKDRPVADAAVQGTSKTGAASTPEESQRPTSHTHSDDDAHMPAHLKGRNRVFERKHFGFFGKGLGGHEDPEPVDQHGGSRPSSEEPGEDYYDDESYDDGIYDSGECGSEGEGEEEGYDPREFLLEMPTVNQEEEAAKRQILRGLSGYVLFQGCSKLFLEGLLSRATAITLAGGEQLDVATEDSLLIVKSGAVQIQFGSETSPAVTLQRGALLNRAGFLGYGGTDASGTFGAECGAEDGAASCQAAGYHSPAEATEAETKVPEALRDRRHSSTFSTGDPETSAVPLKQAELVFYALCPYALMTRTSGGKDAEEALPVRVTGLSAAISACDGEADVELLRIPSLACLSEWARLTPVEQKRLGVQDLADSVASIERKVEEHVGICKLLEKPVFSRIVPRAHPEIICMIAEISNKETIQDEAIAVEGEDDDDLICVLDGICAIEHRAGKRLETSAADQSVLEQTQVKRKAGRLTAGAIIGDVALLGQSVPRPASVCAKTRVEAVRIGAAGLSAVLRACPGALSDCAGRVRETAGFVRDALPPASQVLRSVRLFGGMPAEFLDGLAGRISRSTFLLGQAVVEEGGVNISLFVLEAGRCAAEVSAQQAKLVELCPGTSFGEQALAGAATTVEATVRVLTPFAIVMEVSRGMVMDILTAQPEVTDEYQAAISEPAAGSDVCGMLRSAVLFSRCSQPFLMKLGQGLRRRLYLPGQSISVERDRSADPFMYICLSGAVVVESCGEELGVLPAGSTFGELAFLAYTQHRTASFVAASPSVVVQIPRSFLKQALRLNPDQAKFVRAEEHAAPMWPFFEGFSEHFNFLVSLCCRHAAVPEGDADALTFTSGDVACLIAEGEAVLMNNAGQVVETLTPGCCVNERVLVGASPLFGLHFVAKRNCKVRLLSKESLGQAVAEFHGQKERIGDALLQFMVWRATQPGGGISLLQSGAALFQDAPILCLEEIVGKMRPLLYAPGQLITAGGATDGEVDRSMYVILEGSATLKHSLGEEQVACGRWFGEPVLLSIVARHSGSLYSNGFSLCWRLTADDLELVLAEWPCQRKRLALLRDETGCVDQVQARELLARSGSFCHASPEVLAELVPWANVVLFPPGGVIIDKKEKCVIGETCFYMVLGGSVHAEGSLGTSLATITRGESFGEMGAFGLTQARTATMCASGAGLVACCVIPGPAISEALRVYPEAQDSLGSHFIHQAARNTDTEKRRRVWLTETAVPALQKTALFAACPETFLHDVAVTLTEVEHPEGVVLAQAGTEATSMIVLLSGTADLFFSTGKLIGSLTAGSVFGEVACLGLFPHWMGTLKTTSTCRVMTVTHSAFQRALSGRWGRGLAAGLKQLLADRREQVVQGLPLAGLPWVDVEAAEAGVRAVALLSEKVVLSPGRKWCIAVDPLPFIGFLMKGRAKIEVDMMGEMHHVQTATAGSIIHEGLVLEFAATIRAECACEGYRLRQTDFDLAVTSDPRAQRWIYIFRLKVKQEEALLRSRLVAFQGLTRTLAPHPLDRDIVTWAHRIKLSEQRALRLRELRDATVPFTDERIRDHAIPAGFRPIELCAGGEKLERKRSTRGRPVSHHEANRGLKYYAAVKAVKLPQIPPSSASGVRRVSSAPHFLATL